MQGWVIFCMLFLYSSYIRPICVLYKTYINRLKQSVFIGLGERQFLCIHKENGIVQRGNMFIEVNKSSRNTNVSDRRAVYRATDCRWK